MSKSIKTFVVLGAAAFVAACAPPPAPEPEVIPLVEEPAAYTKY